MLIRLKIITHTLITKGSVLTVKFLVGGKRKKNQAYMNVK